MYVCNVSLIFRGVLILLIFDNIYHTYTHVTHLQKTRLFPKKKGGKKGGAKSLQIFVWKRELDNIIPHTEGPHLSQRKASNKAERNI